MNMKRLFLLLLMCWVGPLWGQGYKTEMIVALDGSGDFTSIQEAIYSCKAFPDVPITIRIKNGTYREKVKVPSWNTRLSLIGEDRAKTIITFDDHFDKVNKGRNSTFSTYTLEVDANDFRAENLTIENGAGPVGQAVALHVEGDRCTFKNCSLLGNQDTVYLAGEHARHYFVNCYIEGTTDFIFGEATAIFKSCEIHSKADSYITAASTPKGVAYGFVFMQCKLTAATGVSSVYLGRAWRANARTVFIECELGSHIKPEGWNNWNNKDAEQNTFYAEYKSTGAGSDFSKRVSWSKQLTAKETKKYSVGSIFRGWNPD